MTAKLTNVMLRGFAVWLAIIFIESVHGMLRELFLKPLVGDLRARQIGFFSALIIIFTITLVFVRWINASNNKQLLIIGLIWVALTTGFEAFIVRPALDVSWEQFVADYNIFVGGMMAFGLIILAFAPLTASSLRNKVSVNDMSPTNDRNRIVNR